jgi:hypothetical protein
MCCEVQSETHAAIKTKRSERSLGYATKKIFPSLWGSYRDIPIGVTTPPSFSLQIFIYTNPLRNVSITQKYISLKAEHHPSYYPAASQTLGPNLA